MSGSDLQGRWMPSSVMEEDVLKLQEAKYLSYEISHRLPTEGQAIPTPEPGEYVVMEIQPVVEHEPSHERIRREA